MVNFSSGRYFSGNAKEAVAHLPFDAGFEAVGIVASIGDSVKHIKVGTPVALMTFGSYAEFMLVEDSGQTSHSSAKTRPRGGRYVNIRIDCINRS